MCFCVITGPESASCKYNVQPVTLGDVVESISELKPLLKSLDAEVSLLTKDGITVDGRHFNCIFSLGGDHKVS